MNEFQFNYLIFVLIAGAVINYWCYVRHVHHYQLGVVGISYSSGLFFVYQLVNDVIIEFSLILTLLISLGLLLIDIKDFKTDLLKLIRKLQRNYV